MSRITLSLRHNAVSVTGTDTISTFLSPALAETQSLNARLPFNKEDTKDVHAIEFASLSRETRKISQGTRSSYASSNWKYSSSGRSSSPSSNVRMLNERTSVYSEREVLVHPERVLLTNRDIYELRVLRPSKRL